MSMVGWGYVGVTVETARIFTGSTLRLRAYSMLQTTTAAAPSLVAQLSKRRRGSATMGDSSTCSRVKSLW